MTSYDLLGPPRASQDLLGISMNSNDFTMILSLFYNETMTSYDLLGPPRTSQDLPGPPRNYYDLLWFYYDSNIILQWN